jgi:HSP20 family protein
MKNMMIYDAAFPALRLSRSIFGDDNPFDALERLIASEPFLPEGSRAPAVDVSEDEEKYRIVAELPGMSEKDLKLEIKEGILSLSAKKEEEAEAKEGSTWIRRERRASSFSRSWTLPENADEEKVSAQFKDGLLTVDLPKKALTPPRQIPVKAA